MRSVGFFRPAGPAPRCRAPEEKRGGRRTKFFYSYFVPTPHLSPRLLDHPVRTRQHVRRNGQADLLRGFEIDDQFELRWLFDGEVGGLRAFENLVDELREPPVGIVEVRAVGHQPAAFDIFLPSEHRWKTSAGREARQLIAARECKSIRKRKHASGALFADGLERRLEVGWGGDR